MIFLRPALISSLALAATALLACGDSGSSPVVAGTSVGNGGTANAGGGGTSPDGGSGGRVDGGGGGARGGAGGAGVGGTFGVAGSSGAGGVNAGKGGGAGKGGKGGGAGTGGSVSTGGGAGGSGGTGGSGGSAGTGDGFAGFGGGASSVCTPEILTQYASGSGQGQLPGPPIGAPAGDGAPIQFAMKNMFVGDTTFAGQSSSNGWKELGLDLDGVSSDKGFGCHCKAAAKQATTDIRTDGFNGIDNSFGYIVISQGTLPIEGASKGATEAIEAGEGSLVLSFADLGSAASYGAVKATVSPVRMLGGKVPSFDQTDSWTPFAGGPRAPVTLDGGWVNDHTWVSPPTSETLMVTVPIAGISMNLPLRRARITAKLSADRLRIERGMIAGIMQTEAFIDEMREVAENLNLCGAAFDAVAEQLAQAADSPLNGPHDAAIQCEGISVGIGFQAERTGPLAAAVAPVPKGPSPCNQP